MHLKPNVPAAVNFTLPVEVSTPEIGFGVSPPSAASGWLTKSAGPEAPFDHVTVWPTLIFMQRSSAWTTLKSHLIDRDAGSAVRSTYVEQPWTVAPASVPLLPLLLVLLPPLEEDDDEDEEDELEPPSVPPLDEVDELLVVESSEQAPSSRGTPRRSHAKEDEERIAASVAESRRRGLMCRPRPCVLPRCSAPI